MQLAMVDGKIKPFEELEPAYLDRGIFFGDGVYEVIRSYDGRIFALEEHLRRFAGSLAAVGIDGVDMGLIRGRVLKVFDEARIADAKIYFHTTRGSAPRSHAPVEGLRLKTARRQRTTVSQYRPTRIGDGKGAISSR